MYITPLAAILEHMNLGTARRTSTDGEGEPAGVFYNDPRQTLTLVIDFKTGGLDTWSHLYAKLQPLRDGGWLTHWNGTARIERPLTIVASGLADLAVLTAHHPYRDIFYDAPLHALSDPSDNPQARSYKYNPSNSYLASAHFAKAVGNAVVHKGVGGVTEGQVGTIQGHVRDARERGLVPRYWGTPRWPRGLRDEVWTLLMREDIGLLNVDDLRAVRKGNWGSSGRRGGGVWKRWL